MSSSPPRLSGPRSATGSAEYAGCVAPGGAPYGRRRSPRWAAGSRSVIAHLRHGRARRSPPRRSLGPERRPRGPLGHTVGVPATILDGKATAAAIRSELTGRVAALAAAGHRPGLGTLLVGDDPGSRWYVNAKHSDCAQVGIASIQRELPATATLADVLAVVEELNADPACTGYIVQLPLPAGIDESVVLEAMDPAKDADGLHPVNLGRLVLNVPGAAAVHPGRHRRAAAPLRGADRRRRGRRRRPRHHRRPPARAAAHPPHGERHRDAVPHRHPRPRRARALGRHRGGRGRRARG